MLFTQYFSACFYVDINTLTSSNPCMLQSVLMVTACSHMSSLNACVFVCMSSCVQSALSRSLATLNGSQSSLAFSALDGWQIGAHGPSVSIAPLRPHLPKLPEAQWSLSQVPKGHPLCLLFNLCIPSKLRCICYLTVSVQAEYVGCFPTLFMEAHKQYMLLKQNKP